MSKEVKQYIASLGNIELLKAFRMGFEFEFHALDGLERNDLESTEYDYDDCDHDALREASSDALAHVDGSDLEEMLPQANYRDDTKNEAVRLLRAIFEHISFWDVERMVNNLPNGTVTNAMQNILEEIQDSWRETWESDELENNPENYYSKIPAEYDFDTRNLPLELGTDSSVRGGEIRTLGGLTVSQFIQCARHVFKHKFEVDEGCSFHIHLSLPGIKHTYGKEFQANVIAYLLDHMYELPDSVIERLQSSAIRWCKPELATDKYTMVHKHPQNTWEFRLFGNITNTKDAIRCLMLACRALQNAYRLQLAKQEARLTERLVKADQTFSGIAANAIETRTGFTDTLRAYVRGRTRNTNAA
jgi:hypothetical protein